MQSLANLSIGTIIETKKEAFTNSLFPAFGLLEKQEQAMRVLCFDTSVKELLYGGAAGGGKSYLGCEWLLWSCLSYPGTRWFIGRHNLKQIRESVIVTFRKVCEKHDIPNTLWSYNDQIVKITFPNGSEIVGLEMAEKPGQDPDFARFGSAEFTGGWIEEGGGIPFKAYDVAKSRIGRHLNDKYNLRPKLLITCNPTRNWIYRLFYKPWKDKGLIKEKFFIQSFVDENTKVDKDYISQLDGLSGEMKARLRHGDWEYQNDPLMLCEIDALADIYTNSYIAPDLSRKRLVVDVATHGSDLFRIGVFAGGVLIEHAYFEKSGGKEIVNHIRAMQRKHSIRDSAVIYDADGVGSFVGQKGGFIPGAIPFHGGAAPIPLAGDKRKQYFNLKSQCAFFLAEQINEGKIWAKAVISETDREILTDELAWIKRASDISDGPLRIVSKEEVRAGLGRSPDFSDLFLMSVWFDLRAMSVRKIERKLV